MSYLGIVLISVFSANVLLVYGLGVCPAVKRERKSPLSALVALTLTNLMAALLLWSIRVLVLAPLGLSALEPIMFMALVAPLVKYAARAGANAGAVFAKIGALADESAVSCLVFGVALTTARSDYGFFAAVASSAAASFGYWAALVLLDALRERLELADLPVAMRGAPAILASAGLMAMAFMGIDAGFIRNMVG